MNWAQLPVDGGLYSQHPELLDKFVFIFEEQARHEKDEREKEARKNKQQPSGLGRRRGRRRK